MAQAFDATMRALSPDIDTFEDTLQTIGRTKFKVSKERVLHNLHAMFGQTVYNKQQSDAQTAATQSSAGGPDSLYAAAGVPEREGDEVRIVRPPAPLSAAARDLFVRAELKPGASIHDPVDIKSPATANAAADKGGDAKANAAAAAAPAPAKKPKSKAPVPPTSIPIERVRVRWLKSVLCVC
jgi:hypothetical protein